jgi:tungstate transport system ATP-binding protein
MPAAALKVPEDSLIERPSGADDGPLPLVLERVGFEAGGQRLIEDVSLTLDAGARTVILGPNGAGKSLLLRLCHGLIRPTTGRIRWTCGDPARLRREQAFVFQRPVLLRRSAAANVAYALAVAGVARAERRRRVDTAMAQVGLAQIADRPARVLSGGEQRRLALARAWALAPKVLFLDEPTANLDPAATRAIEAVIAAMGAAGVKIVMTTHDLGQARRQADEIVFLHKGRLIEHADAARFFARPATPEARAFVAGELLA